MREIGREGRGRRAVANRHSSEDPIGVMNPARKRPTSIYSIAARDGFGLAFGQERTGHRQNAFGVNSPSSGSGQVGSSE
jgi:hypothetical protein